MIKEKNISSFLDYNNCYGTYIVEIMYKYDYETDYRFTREVLQYNGSYDCYEYLNDWNEGETDCWVRGVVDIDDVDITEGLIIPNEEDEINA